MLFHPHTRYPLGFFDFNFLLMKNPRLGWKKTLPWDPPAEGAPGMAKSVTVMSPLERAQQLYKFRTGEKVFLFKPDLELGAFLARAYAERVDQEFSGPKKIERIAEETELADRQEGYDRRYRIVNLRGVSSGFVTGNYLTRRLVVDEDIREEDFHRDTKRLFKNFQLPSED